jgi:SAM-dependent methyltransferase
MDYDLTNIPAAYDRGRSLDSDVLELWMHALQAHVQDLHITRILDLGCGTGRFSEILAAHFNAEVAGIDPSRKMLEHAREKRLDARVQYQVGSGEDIPLPAASVDMIFMSMSFHHFTDRVSAARECRRVVRSKGLVFVRTGTREQISAYPYVPFFPSTPAIIREVLPDRPELCEAFEKAGFQLKAWELVTQTIAPSWQIYVDRVSAGGDSVLARLHSQELESGLAAMRRHGTSASEQPIVEPIDLFVFRDRVDPRGGHGVWPAEP